MTVAIVVYMLIVTVPLVGAAILTERLCRLWSLPVRGAWAVAALLIMLVGARTMSQQLVAPQATFSITAINGTHSSPTIAVSRLARLRNAAAEVMSLPRDDAAYVAHTVGPSENRAFVVLWIVMSVAMLALLCVVYTKVWRARRSWRVVDFVGQRVRVAPHAGPAVVGLFRPEIVVPRWVLDTQSEDSRLIVMHEMEHRTARDPLLLAAMWALVALFPWHPGAWYCLARTRLAIELDCDARVVGRGASLRTYAQLLVNQASARLGAPMHLWLGATSLLEPSTHLERRLRAMIVPQSSNTGRRSFTRYLRTASYMAIVSTIAIAACESHVPTAADISGLDAASAQTDAAKMFTLTSDSLQPSFYVDGVAVTGEKARQIAADSIASIRIVRPDGATGVRQVRILTLKTMNGTKLESRTDTLVATALPLAGGTVMLRTTPDGKFIASHTDTVSLQAFPRRSVRLVTGKSSEATSLSDVLIFIDGVQSDAAAFKAINPDRIATIDVQKGPAAMKQSTDPRAKNGIIRITLEHDGAGSLKRE